MKTPKIIFSAIAIVTILILAISILSLVRNPKTSFEQAPCALNKIEVEQTPDVPPIETRISLSKKQPIQIGSSETDLQTEEDEEQEKVDPVIMTDYQNWTVIAKDIEQNENQSIATGDVGVAHRDGLFAVANEGIITHTNQSGSIDSIYLPGESSLELGEMTMSSTDTELIQQPDGSHTIRAKKLELHESPNVPIKIIVNGKEISIDESLPSHRGH